MSMNTYIYYGNELYHHGVKGQHWGQRRYQNADGSYKSGAEGRYASPLKKIKSKIKGAVATVKKARQERREAKEARKYIKRGNKTRVAMALVGGALVAYGGYKLSKKIGANVASGAGKKEVSTALAVIGKTKNAGQFAGLNEIVIDNRPKEIRNIAKGAAAATVAGSIAFNKFADKTKRNNMMSNDAINYDEEFATSKQGRKLGKEYSKRIEKMETSENYSPDDEDKFYRAEENYLRASSRYQGQKLLKKYGKKEMEQYLKSKGVKAGKDLVKAYEDYDWKLHTY